MNVKTVVFDFYGVIHSYTSGWKGEENNQIRLSPASERLSKTSGCLVIVWW